MKFFRRLIILLLVYGVRARALDISEETTSGVNLLAQSLSVEGDVGGDEAKEVEPPWSWNADYTYTRSVSTASDGSPLIDSTSDYSLGGGWKGKSGLELDIALQQSDTPAEKLTSHGGTFEPGMIFEYGPKDADDFQAFWELKLNSGSTNYLESFSGTVRGVKKASRPVSGTAELRQSLLGLKLSWKPVWAWKYSIGADHYGYNRDVVQFQHQLDSPTALRRGVSGFSNTVGGLPRVIYSASVAWAFLDHWKTTLSESLSLAAVDGSASTITKDVVEFKFTTLWRLTAGLEWEKSNSANIGVGIFGLEWDID